MFELGPHASYIIGAYALAFASLGTLVLVTFASDRKQRRLLADLERRGITRRSAAPARPASSPTVTRAASEKPST
ncbi:MAG: heme exporter protein CcmD [Pseudomonadota bacterium]